jgi:hypothetical protein
MLIANPIYDVVFKYLLDDKEIAQELFSTILGVKIIDLQVKPQETMVKNEAGEIKIFHLDFKAVIDLENGTQKTVLIELQKAKKSYDILRFRKYLGENYTKEEFRKGKDSALEGYSLEIVTIYLLGFQLEGVEAPVLKVGRKYIDVISSKEISTQHDFITHLTHESYTIQIPRLTRHQRTHLEEVLEIFTQDKLIDGKHKIDFQTTSKNPLVKKMAKRLSKAVSKEEIRRNMDAEDMMERILRRELLAEREKFEEEMKEKQQEVEKAQQEAEKAQQKIEISKALQEAEKERLERERVQEEMENLKKQLESLQHILNK